MRKRFFAAFIHLIISGFVVGGVFFATKILWYPDPYFDVVGVGHILIILCIVDVTIGPMLTLVIFNPAKKYLKFDLLVVAVLQLSALLYGISTVFSGRPVYLVYNLDRFTLVTAAEIAKREKVNSVFFSLPITGPEVVGAKLPEDNKQRKKILMSSLSGGPDLPQMPKYYVPYEAITIEVQHHMQPLANLTSKLKPSEKAIADALIEKTLSQSKLKEADIAYLPATGKILDMVVIVRKKDAAVVEVLPINPWN